MGITKIQFGHELAKRGPPDFVAMFVDLLDFSAVFRGNQVGGFFGLQAGEFELNPASAGFTVGVFGRRRFKEFSSHNSQEGNDALPGFQETSGFPEEEI